MSPALSDDKKLNVLYRIEPGCLGPQGVDHVEKFCAFAIAALAKVDSDYVIWNVVPRYDKSLPEMQYGVANKSMNHDQAEKYLQIFGKSLDEFEGHLDDHLAELIDAFMGQ